MKKFYLWGLVHAALTLVYVAIVGLIMMNGDRLFGQMNNVIGPVGFLLLFTLSALIVGSLVLGKPVLLYLDGKKKEGLTLFFTTAGFLTIFTLVAFIILAVY